MKRDESSWQPPPSIIGASASTERGSAKAHFNTLHMLRGLAAMWVVLFHIHSFSLTKGFAQAWPAAIYRPLFEFGRGGVAVFFVLSGFVIAYSLSGKALDLRGFGQFWLRRSVRLDPPYVVSIIFSLTVTAAINWEKAWNLAMPSFGEIVAHILYLQELLTLDEISPVYWTLTYEVQFYLVWSVVLALGQTFRSHKHPAVYDTLSQVIVFAVALTGAVAGPGWAPAGVFLNYWYAFYLGVAVQRAVLGRGSVAPALVIAAAMLLFAHRTTEVFNTPAALTGLSLLALGKANRLNMRRAWKPVLWLGTISYSLYLTHYPVLLVTLGTAYSVAAKGAGATWLAVFFQLAVTLAAALIFYRVIEKPSQEWSKRLQLRGRQAAVAAPLVSEGGT